MKTPRLTTAVIGAGPAGLLFAVAARALWARTGHAPDGWRVLLFDKREAYERTHRLRMDPKPYRALAAAVDHPVVDDLMVYLDGHRWRPAVGDLEQQLLSAANALGVDKRLLDVGGGSAPVPIEQLPAWLTAQGELDQAGLLSVVAADSVHSEIRDAVATGARRTVKTHQGVARLLVRGEGLPPSLSPVEQLKLSKLLGSVIDYRLNPGGFAEVDLFLSAREFVAVQGLGATPKQRVVLDEPTLTALAAPLFCRIVDYMRRGLTNTSHGVELFSTFKLEHAFVEPTSFALPTGGRVFLVGDAATSLPFFRGMACLAKSVHHLAVLHVDLAARAANPDTAPHVARSLCDGGPSVRAYERAIDDVREQELSTVGARAGLIRVAREFVRISAMAPFPIQSWLLSIPQEPEHPRQLSAAFWLNFAFASLALGLALAGPVLTLVLGIPWGVLSLAALPVQAAGGVLYHYTRDHLPRSLPLVAVTWRLQIATALVVGVAVTGWASAAAGRPAGLWAAFIWFFLGLAFVGGLYVFEGLWRRWRATTEGS